MSKTASNAPDRCVLGAFRLVTKLVGKAEWIVDAAGAGSLEVTYKVDLSFAANKDNSSDLRMGKFVGDALFLVNALCSSFRILPERKRPLEAVLTSVGWLSVHKAAKWILAAMD